MVIARNVEESRWHDSQKTNRNPDGSLDFEVTLASFEELKSWLLSFSWHAEVLQPKQLRKEMAMELRAACGQYEDLLRTVEGKQR